MPVETVEDLRTSGKIRAPELPMRTVDDMCGQTCRLLFLFVDVVAYSREPDARQLTIVTNLQDFVRKSSLVQLMEPDSSPWKHTIMLPTGDGMAFCFANGSLFEHPGDLLAFARHLRTQCTAHNVGLRMGLHAEDGQLYLDINQKVNVAGNGINIAARVMSQADSGQILASGAFYNLLAAKTGETQASSELRLLGAVQVKHGVNLTMYVHVYPNAPDSWSAEPSKQRERRLIQENIQTNLQRIEAEWNQRLLKEIPTGPVARGTDSPLDPELRMTILHAAANPIKDKKQLLRVSSHRYMRHKPWSMDPPSRVEFEEGQGPGKALLAPRVRGGQPIVMITSLPDTEGRREPGDPKYDAYAKQLHEKSGTPFHVIAQLRRHARSYFYIPFGFGDERDPWEGVIAIDSSWPMPDWSPERWRPYSDDIADECDAIGYLWRLLKRV